MPQNKFQKVIFALITVIITVNAFVFYNVFFVEHSSYAQRGAPMILSFLAIEFVCAIAAELLIGSPGSLHLAQKIAAGSKLPPFLFETIIICCTVCIMCPLMSFLAVFIYNGGVAWIMMPESFSISEFFINFIPSWATKVFYNFPFALFAELFFIQPLVRFVFRKIFAKNEQPQLAPTAE